MSEVKSQFFLKELSFFNLLLATRIAKECFPDEWMLVLCTYVWTLMRTKKMQLNSLFAQTGNYTIWLNGQMLGTATTFSSRLYGKDVRWIRFGDSNPTPELISSIIARWPNMLLIFLLPPDSALLLHSFKTAQIRELPDGELVFTLDNRKMHKNYTGKAYRFIKTKSKRLSIDCKFHIFYKNGLPIGITGMYRTNFWPGVAWGGWGGLIRAKVQRNTAVELLKQTISLGDNYNDKWFLLETSSSDSYKAAKWLYSYFGLQNILKIPAFYMGNNFDPEDYLIYGFRYNNTNLIKRE